MDNIAICFVIPILFLAYYGWALGRAAAMGDRAKPPVRKNDKP